jgi:hypothetical protein
MNRTLGIAVLATASSASMVRAEPTRSTSLPDLSPITAFGVSVSVGGRADKYVLGAIAATELWIDWAVLPQLKLGGTLAAGAVYFDGDETAPVSGSYLDNAAVWARGIHRWFRSGATIDGGVSATIRLPIAQGMGPDSAAWFLAPMLQLARRPVALAVSDPAVALDADLHYNGRNGFGRLGIGVVMIGASGLEIDVARIALGAGTRVGSRWVVDGALHVAVQSNASGSNSFLGIELGATLEQRYSWSFYWPVESHLGLTGLLTFGIHFVP